MIRRLFNLAAAVSLVLCVASVALWIRSYVRSDALAYVPGDAPLAYVVWSDSGQLMVGRVMIFNFDPKYYNGFIYRTEEPGGMHGLILKKVLGVGWLRMSFYSLGVTHPATAGKHVYILEFPMWMLAGMCAGVPVIWAICPLLSRGRFVKGTCIICGYDLRATPDRCPECGTVPAQHRGEGASPSRAS